MKIVTSAEMREIDRLTTEQYGVPSLTLMENAGTAVAEFCAEQYPKAQRVGVICGKGNNGGDGFVAARKLREAGKDVQVLLLADPADVSGEAAEMLRKLPIKPVIVRTEEELKSEEAQKIFAADLLVDAILGAGFKPPVTGIYAAAIQQLMWAAGIDRLVPFGNEPTPVVAIDVPSGADADTAPAAPGRSRVYGPAVWASAVVTFTAPKRLHATLVFPAVVADIGSPAEAVESASKSKMFIAAPVRSARSAKHDAAYQGIVSIAPRAAAANKGEFGHVLVVGGSRGKAGAAAMAGMAALRSGAGLCTVATARGVQNLVAGFAPELMTEDLEETEQGTISLRALEYGRIDSIATGKTVLAVGPGISRNEESAELVRTLVHRRTVPVVLDADGLNAFEGKDARLEGSGVPLVITPHPGELARLTGLSVEAVQADRVGVARKFAHDHDCVVVLKGYGTVTAVPDGQVWINPTGNPGMATGGTGDVLTGMVAGMIGGWARRLPELASASQQVQQSYKWFLVQRVVTAVYLHGLAGDITAEELGETSMTATDLLNRIPAAIKRIAAMRGDKWVWVSRRPFFFPSRSTLRSAASDRGMFAEP